jgi:hypothetical protein
VSLTCPPTKNPRASVVWLGRTGLIVLSLCLPKTGIQTSRVALLPVLAFPKSPVSIHVLARAGGVRVCGLLLGARWQPSQRRKGWMPSLLGVVRDHFSMGQPGQRGQSHGRDRRRGVRRWPHTCKVAGSDACASNGPQPRPPPKLTIPTPRQRPEDTLPHSPRPPHGRPHQQHRISRRDIRDTVRPVGPQPHDSHNKGRQGNPTHDAPESLPASGLRPII